MLLFLTRGLQGPTDSLPTSGPRLSLSNLFAVACFPPLPPSLLYPHSITCPVFFCLCAFPSTATSPRMLFSVSAFAIVQSAGEGQILPPIHLVPGAQPPSLSLRTSRENLSLLSLHDQDT